MNTNNSRTIIKFESLDKELWLRRISSVRARYGVNVYHKYIVLEFNSNLKSEDFEPIHFVTLACLIQFFDQNNHKVLIASGNDSIRNMLFLDLRIQEYWSGGKNHVDSVSDNIFNLWRIIESYYNVFDHADANGNAFSLIKYDDDDERLHVAICDFGKGIAKSVRDFTPDITNDRDALLKSIETDFTVGSKSHNKGKGLDNILSCSSVVRIFCNNALLLKTDAGGVSTFDVNFHFGGTLIYLEIDLSLTEDEEILEEFDL